MEALATAARAGAPAPARTRVPRTSVLDRLLIALPTFGWFVLAWSHRWITDDGLIAARTVRQILAGNGPVFNAGERVESNTSALWTWLLALLAWVSQADVYTVMLWTGLILAPAGLVFAQLGTRRILLSRPGGGNSARPLIPLGAVVVAALPPFWDFATSGLESPLIFFWLGWSWWLLAGAADGRTGLRAAVLGLGWLVRPELAMASAILLAALFFVTRPGKAAGLRIAACALALPVAYEIFRMGYYGLLVPNTALVKQASSQRLGLGVTYLANYTGPYSLWIPAALLVLVLWLTRAWRQVGRSNQVMLATGAAIGLVIGGYVVWIGGDFMHARMLLPATFALLLPVMTVPLPSARTVRGWARVWAAHGTIAAVAVWALICVTSLRYDPHPEIPANGITNERLYWVHRTHTAHPVDAGPYTATLVSTPDPLTGVDTAMPDGTAAVPSLRVTDASGRPVAYPLARPGASIALQGTLLGRLGAIVPLDGLAIDVHGLSYAVGSHLAPNGTRVGHEKTTSDAWILADYTTGDGSGSAVSSSDVLAARQALSCGEFARLAEATRAPMSFSRFFGNIGESFSLTSFESPNDPAAAGSLVCR